MELKSLGFGLTALGFDVPNKQVPLERLFCNEDYGPGFVLRFGFRIFTCEALYGDLRSKRVQVMRHVATGHSVCFGMRSIDGGLLVEFVWVGQGSVDVLMGSLLAFRDWDEGVS